MRNLYNITITISERIFHSISDSSSIDSIYSSFRNSNYYLVKNTVSNVVQVSTGNKILSQSKHLIRKLNENFKKN
jgi:ribosome recycling factor